MPTLLVYQYICKWLLHSREAIIGLLCTQYGFYIIRCIAVCQKHFNELVQKGILEFFLYLIKANFRKKITNLDQFLLNWGLGLVIFGTNCIVLKLFQWNVLPCYWEFICLLFKNRLFLDCLSEGSMSLTCAVHFNNVDLLRMEFFVFVIFFCNTNVHVMHIVFFKFRYNNLNLLLFICMVMNLSSICLMLF